MQKQMNELINEVKEKYSEHLEMCDDPNELLVKILAVELINCYNLNTFLKKRLKEVEKYASTINTRN